MRVTNNPRIAGQARTVQSWSKADKPLTLADYQKMLRSEIAQRDIKIRHGYSTKFHDRLIAQYEAEIAKF